MGRASGSEPFSAPHPLTPSPWNGEGERCAFFRLARHSHVYAAEGCWFDVVQMRRRARTFTAALATALRRQSTPSERAAWEILRDRRCLGLKFRRQHPIAGFVVDFYCPALDLVVEIDGTVHQSPGVAERDAERSTALARLGLEVVRVPNEKVSSDELLKLLTPFVARRRWQ